jgi:hypothetical protein
MDDKTLDEKYREFNRLKAAELEKRLREADLIDTSMPPWSGGINAGTKEIDTMPDPFWSVALPAIAILCVLAALIMGSVFLILGINWLWKHWRD